MTAKVSLRLLSVAALLAVGAQAAAAQSDASFSIASPASAGWNDRPTGKYLLELEVPQRTNKVNLTISDSTGGALSAVFWPVGDSRGHAMTVRVQDSRMILEAYTPSGLFEIVLVRQGDLIAGQWTLGDAKGVVQGQVEDDAQ